MRNGIIATMTIGKLDEFDPANETVTAYIERAELFLVANSVADKKKVAVFLSVLGSKTYSRLRNLMMPDNPKDKSFDEIVEKLKEHYEPKVLNDSTSIANS